MASFGPISSLNPPLTHCSAVLFPPKRHRLHESAICNSSRYSNNVYNESWGKYEQGEGGGENRKRTSIMYVMIVRFLLRKR